MKRECYVVEKSANGLGYTFYSEGPRGHIRKEVRFRLVPRLGKNTFNLAFGDFKEGVDEIDDRSVSNNNDRQKVLFTVVTCVTDFLKYRPSAIILIKPNTLPRARLYQMMISSLLVDVSKNYEIYGRWGDRYLPFRKGLSYEEFIVLKKIL